MAAKTSLDTKEVVVDRVSSVDASSDADIYDPTKPFPTEEEWATLPRVPGTIPWTAWTVAIVEFMERFSYYGTSAVCKLPLSAAVPPLFPANTVVC